MVAWLAAPFAHAAAPIATPAAAPNGAPAATPDDAPTAIPTATAAPSAAPAAAIAAADPAIAHADAATATPAVAPTAADPAVAHAAAPTVAAVAAHAADRQDVPALDQLATDTAQRLLPALTDKQRIIMSPVQPRLQLAHCDKPVRADRAPGNQMAGRVLIELTCDGPVPWHLYVPARVVGTAPVVVAAHALVAGSVLTLKDVTVEQHDLVGLPTGYLDDPAIAVGLTAARAIAGGALLTNQQLLGTQAVQRGQTVTLVADAGGISVRMPGRALSDGLVNQRIKVENLSSGKVVEGIARSAQVVEIIF
jgi:flagella basal body P-ring formation protein FlgA